MRNILDLEFRELAGKFGNWPTDASIPACEAVVRLGRQCAQNAVFVDVGATTGKSTICLAAAAYRVNGKVLVLQNTDAGQNVSAWFNRALLMFKAESIVTRATEISELADFIVAREGLPLDSLYRGLKDNGLMLVLGDATMDSVQPVEKGIGYSVWQKIPTIELLKETNGAANHVQLENIVAEDRPNLAVSTSVLPSAEGGSQPDNEAAHEASAGQDSARNGSSESSHKSKKAKQKVGSALTPERI